MLVFALSSQEEGKQKYFMHQSGLSKKLTEITLRKGHNSHLDCILFSEQKQQGNTFFQRFTNAIKTVFSAGYENIIVVGNDTPQLSTQHILKANHLLEKGQPSIGPSLDGGFYLLALSQKMFDVEKFRGFAWQTPKVFQEVYQYITQELNKTKPEASVYCLPAFNDIDKESQLKILVSQLGRQFRTLLKYLQKALRLDNTISKNIEYYNLSTFNSSLFNKGSPSQVLV